jgi:tubulin-specific chaperone A
MDGDAPDPKLLKDLKIKTGIVKRIAKEKLSYEKELAKQQAKITTMTAADKDDYDLKKQTELLEETRIMIPDCERRLASAWDVLSKLVDSAPDASQTDEYQLAKQTLEETKVTTCQ